MIMHIHMPLTAAFKMVNGSRSDQKKILAMFGFTDIHELRNGLDKMVANGYVSIPAEGCDNHEHGICKGHPSKK